MAMCFEASVSVITLVLLGKWLEQRARRKPPGPSKPCSSWRRPRRGWSATARCRMLPVAEVRVGEVVWCAKAKARPWTAW